MAQLGCPIKGDVKYGARRTNDNASIHLHARRIDFIHPVKRKRLHLGASPDDCFGTPSFAGRGMR